MKRALLTATMSSLALITGVSVIADADSDPTAGAPDLNWSTVDSGGGESSGGDFLVTGTIGQPETGSMSGKDFVVAGGFWAGHTAASGPDCVGDCADGGDGQVNTSDLLAVLATWGSKGGCDFNGDGTVGTPDLLAVLANWGDCF